MYLLHHPSKPSIIGDTLADVTLAIPGVVIDWAIRSVVYCGQIDSVSFSQEYTMDEMRLACAARALTLAERRGWILFRRVGD